MKGVCLTLLALLSVPGTARAQPDVASSDGASGDVASGDVASDLQPDRLAELGRAIAQRAHGLDDAADPWCVRLTVDVDSPEAARTLRTALGDAITRSLSQAGHDVHVVGFRGDGEDAAHIAHRLGYARWLDVRVERRDAEVRAHSELWRTTPAHSLHTWDRATPLDRQLRLRLGWMPRTLIAEAVESRRGVLAGSGYLAMAVVDLDGDRRGELVTVTVRGVQVFTVEPYEHARHGRRLRTRLLGEVRWPEDLPPAASRRRRTVATITAQDAAAVVRTSEHATPMRVRWEAGALRLEPLEGCAGYVLDAGCAVLVAGRDFFDETFLGDEPHVAAANFYIHRQGRFRDRDGTAREFEALITTAGRLSVRVHQGDEARPRSTAAVGYGVALAMSDLDLDGRPELLASHASAPDAPDQLTLLRARARGSLRVVWRSEPTQGPVWAAASGDVDGDGLDELLAIEGPAGDGRGRSRLWMVR